MMDTTEALKLATEADLLIENRATTWQTDAMVPAVCTLAPRLAAAIRDLAAALEQARADLQCYRGKFWYDRLAAAEAERDRLREQLEFYADKDSWYRATVSSPNYALFHPETDDILHDGGEFARRALHSEVNDE